MTADDGGEGVDGSEAQNQPISVVQTFVTELCKFWSDGWMIRFTAVEVKSRKLHFVPKAKIAFDCARIKKLNIL